MNKNTPDQTDRRTFLRRTGLTVGASAVLPLLGDAAHSATRRSTPISATSGSDPDQLFVAGSFDEADRGYAYLLRKDPDNAHALAQRGRIALLSNKFHDAEKFLAKAIRRAPHDNFSKQQLAQCFVRQDKVARAVPLLRATGDSSDAAFATQYASMTGTAYHMRGAQMTRIPMLGIDPLPHVEASVNGGKPTRFLMDTGATLAFSTETAKRAGLRAVATSTSYPAGQTLKTYHGVMESFRLGSIELRNVPVVWYDIRMPNLPDGSLPSGVIGTELFYHFVTTMNYANRVLILRRKTQAQLRELRAYTTRTSVDRLPLWLAGDHVPCTLGSLNDYGPRVVSLDTGGMGMGVMATEESAKRAGIKIDYAHPVSAGPLTLYPIRAAKVSLGKAVERNIAGTAGNYPWYGLFGFKPIGNFTHQFFKQYAITFDYADMNFYILRTTAPMV
ncbi:aspartyl protease family protein [Actinoallomurus sp. NPDC050550]|uniref:aspartyl protease family protein n=1 Tax=Actinoallomurus sp. NPDC050550 TaxID=3154937 RepID=UPI0033C940D5